MRYLLVWLALCFSLGILFARMVTVAFIFLYICCVAVSLGCFILYKKKFVFSFFFLCAAFLLGAAFLASRQAVPRNHITHFLWQAKDSLCTVKGIVGSQPEFKLSDTVFELETGELQENNFKVACCGKILVHVKGRTEMQYGQNVMLKGKLSRIFQGYGKNGLRYREYLARRGIVAVMHVPLPGLVSAIGKPRLTFKGFSLSLKDKIKAAVQNYAHPVPASVVNAMILGEKKGVPPLVYRSMMKTGTVHILVVSGFNTNLVIGVVILLLKALRIPRKIRFFLALPILIMYCVMTGASPPVMRATVMTIVFMTVYYFKREADIFNACALALLIILVANPWQLFEISLQLSFACVLSIVILYPKLKTVLRFGIIKNKVISFIADAFLVSLSAWLGTMGLVAYYFRTFSPITVIANIFIVPLATLITLCGASLVFAAMGCPALASYIGSTCELLVSSLLHINFLLLKIPGASFQF